MIHQVKFDESKQRLRDLIDAALRGEAVFFTRDDQSVVQRVPIQHIKGTRRFGSAKA